MCHGFDDISFFYTTHCCVYYCFEKLQDDLLLYFQDVLFSLTMEGINPFSIWKMQLFLQQFIVIILTAIDIPRWTYGPTFFTREALRKFA